MLFSTFQFVGQNGQVKGHNPGDGSEKSEGIMCTLDHRSDHLFLNPCAYCKRCSYLHICKTELVCIKEITLKR